MNPLTWKREHQLALLCAITLGGVAGLLFGLWHVAEYGYSIRWSSGCVYYPANSCYSFTPGYWLRIAFWIMLGGAFGGAMVYIRQLLRA
jgi:hypothetical protein